MRRRSDNDVPHVAMWSAMRAGHLPCPVCGGVRAHRSGCQVVRKRAIGWALLIGIPAVVATVISEGPLGLIGLALRVAVLYGVSYSLFYAVSIRRDRAHDDADRGGDGERLNRSGDTS